MNFMPCGGYHFEIVSVKKVCSKSGIRILFKFSGNRFEIQKTHSAMRVKYLIQKSLQEWSHKVFFAAASILTVLQKVENHLLSSFPRTRE